MRLLLLLLIVVVFTCCAAGHIVLEHHTPSHSFYYAMKHEEYARRIETGNNDLDCFRTAGTTKCVSTAWNCVVALEGAGTFVFSFVSVTEDNTYTLYNYADRERHFSFQVTKEWVLNNIDTIRRLVFQTPKQTTCVSYNWECECLRYPRLGVPKETWQVDFIVDRDLSVYERIRAYSS